MAPDSGKRIGIIGAGPLQPHRRLFYLRTHGHQVEVFEAQEKAGGMLRYGIPAYRLPPDLLEQEIDQIRDALFSRSTPVHPDRKPRRLPPELRRRLSRPRHTEGASPARRRRPYCPLFSAASISCVTLRSGEPVRVGPRVVDHRWRQCLHRRRPDGAAAGWTGTSPWSALEEAPQVPASPGEIEIAVGEASICTRVGGPCASRRMVRAVFQFLRAGQGRGGRIQSGIRRQPPADP